MKYLQIAFMLSLSFFTFTVSAVQVAGQVTAQCVQCKRAGDCFLCEASSSGGKQCRTVQCMGCEVYTPCGRGRFSAEILAPAGSKIEIDPETIRQIAILQPRFAATLANLVAQGGLIGQSVTVYWSPVAIASQDIEWWLKPKDESSAFFNKLNQKAKRINRRGDPLVVYEIAIVESPDSSLASLKLQVIKGAAADSDYSLLEVDLLAPEKLDLKKRQWEAKQWRIH